MATSDDGGAAGQMLTICVGHTLSSGHDRCACGVRLPSDANLHRAAEALRAHPRFGPSFPIRLFMWRGRPYRPGDAWNVTLAELGMQNGDCVWFA